MSTYATVELVGGPLCGACVPFMKMDVHSLIAQIREEKQFDPLAHSGFDCPPDVLENVTLMMQHLNVPDRLFLYSFGIPWRTSDGMRLRAEFVRTHIPGDEPDGDEGVLT